MTAQVTIYSAPSRKDAPVFLATSTGHKAGPKNKPLTCPDCAGPLEKIDYKVLTVRGFYFCRQCKVLVSPGRDQKTPVLFSDQSFNQILADWSRYKSFFAQGRILVAQAQAIQADINAILKDFQDKDSTHD